MPIVIKWIVFILILQKIQIIYTTVFVVLTFIQWEDVKKMTCLYHIIYNEIRQKYKYKIETK